jgi:hypothetical protein
VNAAVFNKFDALVWVCPITDDVAGADDRINGWHFFQYGLEGFEVGVDV